LKLLELAPVVLRSEEVELDAEDEMACCFMRGLSGGDMTSGARDCIEYE